MTVLLSRDEMEGERLQFLLPRDDQHSAVIGRNGTGKTIGAFWQLSHRSFPTMPWTIVDFKLDPFIEKLSRLDGVKIVDVRSKPPKRPGIYIVQPMAEIESDILNEYLWRVWHNENHGVFIDEGYLMNDNDKAFKTMLMQGRSKHTPLITLSQRPVWLSRSVWSESTIFQCFAVNDDADVKSIRSFVKPYPAEPQKVLPPRHSIWHDVNRNYTIGLRPVPKPSRILETFAARLPKKRGFLGFGS